MFANLGRWCFRNRGKVVLLWLATLIVSGGISGAIGTAFSTEFALPDVESRRGFDILDQHFADSGAGGEGGTIVFRAEQGVDDPEVQRAMTSFFDEVSQIEGLTLSSPYTPEGAQQIAQQGPDAGQIAYAQIGLPRDITLEEAAEIRSQLDELMPKIPGVQIEIGGALLAEFEVPSSELLGLAFAIIVLILAFGSVLAMGLPVGVALAGIGVGTILAGFISNLVTMPDFATTLGLMIGLAVGAAVVVAVTMVASLTLLPALLGFAGERVELTRWRGLIAAGLVALAMAGMALGFTPLIIGVPFAIITLLVGSSPRLW